MPKKKRWHLSFEATVISDAGNIIDALVIASHAALWSLKIPKTRALEYHPEKKRGDEMDLDESKMDTLKTAITRPKKLKASDFELEDYWDDGRPLQDRERLPVCITLNVVSTTLKMLGIELIILQLRTKNGLAHFLDATAQEELATSGKLHLTFAFGPSPILQNIRISGIIEIPLHSMKRLIEVCSHHAAYFLSLWFPHSLGKPTHPPLHRHSTRI